MKRVRCIDAHDTSIIKVGEEYEVIEEILAMDGKRRYRLKDIGFTPVSWWFADRFEVIQDDSPSTTNDTPQPIVQQVSQLPQPIFDYDRYNGIR
jgi:hypothetical protein